MKSNPNIFHLKVQKIEQFCLFELSWGEGQRLTTQIDYSNILTQLYQEWQRAYLGFYQSEHLRGRAVGGGVAAVAVDWHAELVKAETKLMYEFHRWLRSAELYEIRARIAQGNQELTKPPIGNIGTSEPIKIFLTCAPIELDRFPWEAWEIGTEFGTTKSIQVIRSPLNIGANTRNFGRLKNRRARILAILGDDTGLNFQKEKLALESLMKIADVKFTGWQPDEKPRQVIQEIANAIADEEGWDVLFFAGHSNETDMTGGELSVAPGVSISIKEIAPQLAAAKRRGLQVAIFNSCSGLKIADSLIDLGFSQVVVMREPIHNRVAQEFLVLFLQGLGKYLDIYEAMTAARQSLRSHTYPSAYLVPSLFCHPGSKLFRIPNVGWQKEIKKFLPTSLEAIALTASIILSFIPPVKDLFVDGRMLSQAFYRQVTGQISSDEAPPVALVEIDTESITKAYLPNSQIHPLSRTYLGKLIERARELNAGVVGIDFILDAPQKDPRFGDRDLGRAVRRAVDDKMWIIFGAILTSDHEMGVNNLTAIAHRNWTLQGYTDADPYRVELPDDCYTACPISYLMSLVQTANQEMSGLPVPHTSRIINLRTQLLKTLEKNPPKTGNLGALWRTRSAFALQPVIDFSLPPEQVYHKIPAWKFLEDSQTNNFPLIPKQVVLIAAGNDERLGIAPGQPDYSPAPSAMNYWTHQSVLTGGESLAYMTHHFLRRHLVTPIPDLWMIVVAMILGKTVVFALKKQSQLNPKLRLQIMVICVCMVMSYALIAFQLYITAAILLPWLLPSSVFLSYILSATRRKSHA
ncbi:CHASE2 domain-containing protein [Aetokthonos hydrillicola Thurmond2011]|jgi:hypothetical protein|uniref:CHASE2 domain-containing protein n=1 Tax=Aetokthonos hydrillicola Thurmond2011 TaxID=2712845 RepID=A0AAP5I3S6_9CYAN|nr:CHASE2 domain-containing protein [Aetokthonos hydrillicola]MBO3458531.1 CHASE2 domain-containing protein [Aetokthonos hydrillicola CCALA 1050]MBW4584975.1 CHASE2 domain-containing protein [Aetokthonos hydrillicola CCALA 1050]MDR9894266.1 CHASE2 domain-containing protein [Aetokthonos hydrillicola Thurmond2011]